jgi:hypothetical protein
MWARACVRQRTDRPVPQGQSTRVNGGSTLARHPQEPHVNHCVHLARTRRVRLHSRALQRHPDRCHGGSVYGCHRGRHCRFALQPHCSDGCCETQHHECTRCCAHRRSRVACSMPRHVSRDATYADTSLYPSDEEALVILNDILPTGFECGVLSGKVQPREHGGERCAGPIGLTALLTVQLSVARVLPQ